jgi:hypothetical protein
MVRPYPVMAAVIRLTFEHSADGVTLISRQRVEMTLPAQYRVPEEAAAPAFVAEVRGADDAVLHRTAIPNPLEPHREVFSEEPGRSISRVPVAEPEGAFTVIVPDTPEADHLALMTSGRMRDHAGSSIAAMASADVAAGPREIARFSLRDETEADPS